MGKKKLKRNLGFWDLLLFGIGGIVGAGIYAIIGQAAGLSGNLLWLSFTVAAIVALLTGLSYAEFVSRFPDAGGSFEYIKQGLGAKTALFMSIFMTLTGIVAAAAIAISFAEYLNRLTEIPQWTSVLGIIALMAFFNIIGSRYSSYFNTVATIITLVGLLGVIVLCIPDFASAKLLDAGNSGLTGILSGSALIFFSYIGFEDLVKMAEDAKNPRRDMPKAILISGLVVLLLYVLISVSSLSVMEAGELASTSGPLAAVIETKLGQIGASSLAVVALFATSKSILSNILGTSRLLYDVARDSDISWLKKFTVISGIGSAPNYAILAISIVAMGFALIGDLTVVASISNIFIFAVFGMVNVALLRFRWLHRKANTDEEARFRIPVNVGNLPVSTMLGLLCLIVLLVFNLINIFQRGG